MSKVVTHYYNHILATSPGFVEDGVTDGWKMGDSAFSGEFVDVQVIRLESDTVTNLCSIGFPLPPGTLFAGQLDRVQVIVDDIEQAIYVEALAGRHPDNSIRSILIQFVKTGVVYGTPVSGKVAVGPGVSRGTTDISKTSVSWKQPVLACLPTDPYYLLDCDVIIGQTSIPVDDVPSSPTYLQDYEDDFVYWGDRHWDGTAEPRTPGYPDPWDIFYNYYDRALCWFFYWVRTGEYKWWYRGVRQAAEYIQYLEDSVPDYNPAPRDSLLAGVLIHYWLIGYNLGEYAIQEVAERHRYFHHACVKSSGGCDQRIQSRTMEGYIYAHLIGNTLRDWDGLAAEQLNAMLSCQEPDGSYYGYVSWWDSYVGGVFDYPIDWTDLGGNVWRKDIGYVTIDDPDTSILFNTSVYGVPDTTPDADYDYYYHNPYMDIYSVGNPEDYYSRMQNSSKRHSPYQTGMCHYVYWLYYTFINQDSRILPAIKAALDFEIANGWVPANKSFKYVIPISSSGSPDLAGLSIFGHAWYYYYSKNSTYKGYADLLFEAIPTLAYLYGSKQFNQAYRESMIWQLWRDS